MSDDTKPEERAPKVRTSHHRNKEEAARLQALVDKRRRPDAMSDELQRKIKFAEDRYFALTASERLRLDYAQRKSFARGMCSSDSDFAAHCRAVDVRMPDHEGLTDAQIGLILMNRPWHL